MISLGEVMLHLTCIPSSLYLAGFPADGSYRGILGIRRLRIFLNYYFGNQPGYFTRHASFRAVTHLDAVPEIMDAPYSVVLIHSVVTTGCCSWHSELGVRGSFIRLTAIPAAEYSPC